MSITITFEGLCAFFSNNLANKRLQVGLVEVSDHDLPLSEYHIPKISILDHRTGEYVEYSGIQGRRFLKGDVFLDLISDGSIVPPNLVSELGRSGNSTLLDIENDLLPNEQLRINPNKCRAILHFSHGTLSPNSVFDFPPDDLEYHELKGGTSTRLPDLRVDRVLLYSTNIAVDIPDPGYAVLHFVEGADDYVFKNDRNYTMTVTCLSEASQDPATRVTNHFQYYYRLADNRPSRIIAPVLKPGGQDGNPYCMHGGFGKTP